ncbi:MAG: TspO/MBR family protein, partial [Bauldia sp.]
LMGIAAWLVWRTSAPGKSRALTAFFGQLILNVAWSFAFFGAQNPLFGLVVIVALLAAIAWTIVTFWPVSRLAARLMVPYLAWVWFATLLNAAILTLNGAAA